MELATDKLPTTPPRRWRWRWTIRALLVLVLLLSIPLAWFGSIYRDVQRRIAAAAAIKELGGSVDGEDSSFSPNWDDIFVGSRRSMRAKSIAGWAGLSAIDDAVLANVAAFPELQSLDLDGQPITDRGIRHLRNHRGLRRVSLRGCEVTDASLADLATLPSLENLDLYGTLITDQGLRAFAGHEKLKELDVRQTMVSNSAANRMKQERPNFLVSSGPCVSNEQVRAVIELARHNARRATGVLEYDDLLIFDSCGRAPWRPEDWTILDQFPGMTDVWVSDLRVQDEFVSRLTACRSLSRISFSGSVIEPRHLATLAAAKALTELTLREGLTDDHFVALEHFARLSALTIDCDRVRLSRRSFDAIGKLESLTRLSLCAAKFNPLDVEPLMRLTNLESLDLSRSHVTDESIPFLLQLPKLRVLTLDETKISSRGAEMVMAAKQIEFADWKDTGVEPESYSRESR